MTLVAVVCPGIMFQVCPGCSANVVLFADVVAFPYGLTYRTSAVVMPWSVLETGFVIMPPFGLAATATWDVPPVVIW